MDLSGARPRHLKSEFLSTKFWRILSANIALKEANTMNTIKQQYLVAIRSNTSYPTYRGMIGIIGMLGYALAALRSYSLPQLP